MLLITMFSITTIVCSIFNSKERIISITRSKITLNTYLEDKALKGDNSLIKPLTVSCPAVSTFSVPHRVKHKFHFTFLYSYNFNVKILITKWSHKTLALNYVNYE